MVLLKAYQEQNHIIIEVADDGGGIDVQAVRDSTVKKGFKSQDEVAKLSDADAVNLIFGSGVSTAKKVTEVSGRGVGMDVVKTNIQSLGGTVNLETKLGEGTKFTLRLPLTLATINGLLVISGQATYVIPMASMVEVLRLNDLEVTNVMGTEVIRIREDILPLLDLNRAFGRLTEGPSHSNEGVVVVVRAGDKSVGLTVDAVMEPQEIVIKSLGDYMGGIKGVVGSTILGDGRLALILDTASLVRQTAGV
jgi:two-component system chemotaxis sensor kinase CheA